MRRTKLDPMYYGPIKSAGFERCFCSRDDWRTKSDQTGCLRQGCTYYWGKDIELELWKKCPFLIDKGEYVRIKID